MSPYRNLSWPLFVQLNRMIAAGAVRIFCTYATGPVGDACLFRRPANDDRWCA